jgi:homocysteine S-methyltransferase
MDFQTLINKKVPILTEGSIIERLRRETDVNLNPFVLHASLIYEEKGRKELTRIFQEYIEIGKKANIPMLLCTPTWRGNIERATKFEKTSGINCQRLNLDCAKYLIKIRNEVGPYYEKIFLGGLVGVKGDPYKVNESLSVEEAIKFHTPQIDTLSTSGLDFLILETIPSLSEAQGMVRVLANSQIPYILSFIIRENGCLLDGIRLNEAIKCLDSEKNPPTIYLVNCIYPTVLEKAFIALKAQGVDIRWLTSRLAGIMANGSPKSFEELDESPTLESSNPEIFAMDMKRLADKFGCWIFGGCCGTNAAHLSMIVKTIINKS